jgi:hypothetical protein
LKALFSILIVLVSFLTPCGTHLHAGETSVKIGGYIKNFFLLTDVSDDSTFEALSRLRLKMDISPSASTVFEFAYELLPQLREPGLSFTPLPAPELLSYRAFDLDETIYPDNERSGSDFVLSQNLDRTFLALTTSAADIYAGRQPIAFGTARVISPTDIIAPFTYNTIAKEELVGVDAVRIKKPLAEMGELDLGLVFGEDFEPDKSASFIRLKLYQLQTDIAFMAMIFRKNILLSIDMARSIGGAGVWLEAAQTLAGGASRYRPEENYFRLSTGSDYSFTSKFYAYFEYHYSGAGTSSAEHYFDAISETAFTDGAVYLLGRHYLAPGFSYEITPLIIFNAQALVNIEDGSALASSGIEYNVAQDVYLEFRAYVGIGEKSSDTAHPQNEFGLYPDVYYTALNIYY